jgi:hypothetical protein
VLYAYTGKKHYLDLAMTAISEAAPVEIISIKERK